MRSPTLFRSVLAALIVLFAGLTQARAESGTVTLTVYKGGWIIGGLLGIGGSGIIFSLIVAFIGAVILLFLLRLVTGTRARV